MTAPLGLCACGKSAAWRGHNDGADLCDDCMTWGHEPIWAAVNLPFSAGLIARRRQTVASLALAGDMEADDLQTARWLATLEAVERERDALRAAVARLRAARGESYLDRLVSVEEAAFADLLALLPPEAT